MAALNKQINQVQKMRRWAKSLTDIYAEGLNIKESFDELYSSGDDYSLDPEDTPTDINSDDLLVLGVNYTDLATFVGQAVTQLINFYEGSAVNTREYGKDIRAVEDVN